MFSANNGYAALHDNREEIYGLGMSHPLLKLPMASKPQLLQCSQWRPVCQPLFVAFALRRSYARERPPGG